MNLQKGVLWEHLKKEKIHDEYRKEWFGHVFGLPWEVNKKVLTGGKKPNWGVILFIQIRLLN